eukprot:TRINITY_DN52900_c0_g1_i2.p1 TRINITY_DN52900_c0_g1~~TRINITY_DN52900_c0_g1_i2.p1  ORF type:complete len:590 (-),score=154.99 TRINITY_DN52900_c0_g1_i2:4-1773(-)
MAMSNPIVEQLLQLRKGLDEVRELLLLETARRADGVRGVEERLEQLRLESAGDSRLQEQRFLELSRQQAELAGRCRQLTTSMNEAESNLTSSHGLQQLEEKVIDLSGCVAALARDQGRTTEIVNKRLADNLASAERMACDSCQPLEERLRLLDGCLGELGLKQSQAEEAMVDRLADFSMELVPLKRITGRLDQMALELDALKTQLTSAVTELAVCKSSALSPPPACSCRELVDGAVARLRDELQAEPQADQAGLRRRLATLKEEIAADLTRVEQQARLVAQTVAGALEASVALSTSASTDKAKAATSSRRLQLEGESNWQGDFSKIVWQWSQRLEARLAGVAERLDVVEVNSQGAQELGRLTKASYASLEKRLAAMITGLRQGSAPCSPSSPRRSGSSTHSAQKASRPAAAAAVPPLAFTGISHRSSCASSGSSGSGGEERRPGVACARRRPRATDRRRDEVVPIPKAACCPRCGFRSSSSIDCNYCSLCGLHRHSQESSQETVRQLPNWQLPLPIAVGDSPFSLAEQPPAALGRSLVWAASPTNESMSPSPLTPAAVGQAAPGSMSIASQGYAVEMLTTVLPTTAYFK